MVYKIVGDFDSVNFEKMLDKLMRFYEFIYKDESLFIALRNYSDKDAALIAMRNIFKPARSFVIKEINEKNIMKEDPITVKWCRDSLVELDRQRFEIEQQGRLKRTMVAIDRFEKILAERKLASDENREEESNGRTKTQRKTKEEN